MVLVQSKTLSSLIGGKSEVIISGYSTACMARFLRFLYDPMSLQKSVEISLVALDSNKNKFDFTGKLIIGNFRT